jgi:hypothetical protein
MTIICAVGVFFHSLSELYGILKRFKLSLKGSSIVRTGLPDFSGYNIPTREKIYQITIKYTKWPQNTSNKWPQNTYTK